jgi:hypothetical protein
MKPITLQQFQNNPELRFMLLAAAHRERARLLHAGFDWLLDHLTPRFQAHPSHWIERLG